MKNSIKCLSALVVALFCIGFTACSDDDDDNGTSGKGGKCNVTVTVDGKAYSMPYAHWIINDSGEMTIDLCSWNYDNYKQVMKDPFSVYPINHIYIWYPVKQSQTRIETDSIEHYTMTMDLNVNYNQNTQESSVEFSGQTANNVNSPLIIERDGDIVTLSIKEVEVYDQKGGKTPRIVSVKVVGDIPTMPEGMREDID